jgi:hypothetical protein
MFFVDPPFGQMKQQQELQYYLNKSIEKPELTGSTYASKPNILVII